jgi:hypothetical protein
MKRFFCLTLASIFLTLTAKASSGSATPSTNAVTPGTEGTEVMGGSTPGGEQRRNNTLDRRSRGSLNSAQKMEDRDNNSQTILESDKKTQSDGENDDEGRNKKESKALKRNR